MSASASPASSTAATTPASSSVAEALLLIGVIDPDGPVHDVCPGQFYGLVRRLALNKLDVTESLELARLLVLGESNVRDLSAILERLAYGILVDVERQVTNEYCHAPILLLGGFAGG